MPQTLLKPSAPRLCSDQPTRTSDAKFHFYSKNQSDGHSSNDVAATKIQKTSNKANGRRDSQTAEWTIDPIGNVTTTDEEAHFLTGSSYKGSWDVLGMAGVGRYVMPNGTVYEGEIRDGMFHGHGSLYLPENQRLDVVHLRGELREGSKYTFADGLPYRDVDWSYCKFPDRRFYECTKKGLRPGGRSLRTAKQPTKVLPFGCYDTGDGVFDPKTLCITSYDDSTKTLRLPGNEECDWIVENCRKSWTEPTGYRTRLIENWSDDPPELPYNIAMSEDSPDLWWKRLTKFARDAMTVDDDKNNKHLSKENENVETPKLCMCGEYLILGEPCQCVPGSVSRSESVSHVDYYSNDGKRLYDDEASDSPDNYSPEFDLISSTNGHFETSKISVNERMAAGATSTREKFSETTNRRETKTKPTVTNEYYDYFNAESIVSIDESITSDDKIQVSESQFAKETKSVTNVIIVGTRVIETRDEAQNFPRKLDEENSRIIDFISNPNDSSTLPVKSTEETVAIVANKLHPSLASISPTERKPFNEKPIVEIYNKFPRTDKPTNDRSNPIVWRLSSGLKKCSSPMKIPCNLCGLERKTNTEDLLHSGQTSTASKSKIVECSKKPRVLGLCKPTTPTSSPKIFIRRQ